MKETELNRDVATFYSDNLVFLQPQGLDPKPDAPMAPRTLRHAQAILALVVMTMFFSLLALFLVALQPWRPAKDEDLSFKALYLGDNSTTNNHSHFDREDMKETIQRFRSCVENSNSWNKEIQMLKHQMDNVSSQVQSLGGHVEDVSTDVQQTKALKSKVQTLQSNLQKAKAEMQSLKKDMEATRTLTDKIQEEQSRLGALQEAVAAQEQMQRTQSQLLQLILQDWKVFRGSFYYFSHDKKSWHEAEKFCVSQGAHLASVTSQEEQAFLVKFTGTAYHWIGLTDKGMESNWSWVDGTPFNHAQSNGFWGKNQPDNWRHENGEFEDCVHMQQVWNDMACGATYHWVCKTPIGQAVARMGQS